MDFNVSCEPLRVWNRLDLRNRRPDFSRALRAEVHDALWLLARQWQFGEFQGEDTGSAIFARIAMRQGELVELGARAGARNAYEGLQVPLEPRVERLAIDLDPVTRAQCGQHFLRLLEDQGAAFNRAGGKPRFLLDPYRSLFADTFAIEEPSAPADGDPNGIVDYERERTNGAVLAVVRVLAGSAVDGAKLHEALGPDPLEWRSLPGALAVGVEPAHSVVVLEALRRYRDWFGALYCRPPTPEDCAWKDAQLEYQFDCTVARDESLLHLSVDEYDSGHLDWYSFDVGRSEYRSGLANSRNFTVLPAAVEFAGMPKSRFWELEDGAVDLGNIRADSTDLARVLVAEFALLYGNNWFVVPCQQPVGTLAEIEGIAVTDVFGRTTLVRPAVDPSRCDWARWDFFSLSPRHDATSLDLGAHLFLPPVLGSVTESEPVEEVAFVRDETTNLVWAIERRIPDGLGGSRGGAEAARALEQALAERTDTGEQAPGETPGTALAYELSNTVPGNWIPFVPRHVPGSNRQIQLQRAAMPRFFGSTVRPTRPVTETLRAGLDGHVQKRPMLLHEEEVPRTGVVVETTFQRARWHGGATYVWLGRRVHSGRGEGGSGLRFDTVKARESAP